MIRSFSLFFALLPFVQITAQSITERFEILANGREIYLAWQGDEPQDSTRVLLAIHGSGRSAGSYSGKSAEGNAFYIRQRDIALKAGYLFVSLSNGKDTWGTDEGIASVKSLIAFVGNEYRTAPNWAVWASSAGGVLLARLLREVPGLVDRAIGTFPVYDLADSRESIASARNAWPSPDACREHDPSRQPEVLAPVPYLIFHGQDDRAVPVEKHSLRLRREVNALGGDVTLHVVPGGHSTENFALYDEGVLLEFLGAPRN